MTSTLHDNEGRATTIMALAHRSRRFDHGHAGRVAALSRDIVRHAGIRDIGAATISLCGRLHDIGKTLIPAEVLDAPRRLRPDEERLMRQHPSFGVAMLRQVDGRWPEAIEHAVWLHHERVDGSGYPLGLRGMEIPLSARIVGLADVVDALATSRPYKAAWSAGDIQTEISRGAGVRFDAMLVDACLLHIPAMLRAIDAAPRGLGVTAAAQSSRA